MGWMSLEDLHATIRQASGGTITQASELMAKAKTSLQSLNFDEIMLLVEQFRVAGKEHWRWQSFPGNTEAQGLITAQEGIDEDIFHHVQDYLMNDPEMRKAAYERYLTAEENGETGLYVQMYEPHGFRKIPEHVLNPIRCPSPPPRREMTPEPPTRDHDSSGYSAPTHHDGVHPVIGQRHWPGWHRYDGGAYPLSSKKLFLRDQIRKKLSAKRRPLYDIELSDQYRALTAEERAEYEARTEAVRLAAWDQWEQGPWPQLSTRDHQPEPDWTQLDKLALPRGQETLRPLAPEINLKGRREGPPRRDGTDLAGNPDWPSLVYLDPSGAYPLPPDRLLALDLKRIGETEFMVGGQVLQERYDALPLGEKAELETRSEVLRQAGWDEWEDGGWEERRKYGAERPNWERFDSLNILPPWRKAEVTRSD